jgi:epoxide hydrolase 4
VPGALGGGAPTAPLPPGCVEGHVTINGIRLHYIAAGTGPLVLLLHGFPEFCSSWVLRLR